jgi:signal transduction histidine kinase
MWFDTLKHFSQFNEWEIFGNPEIRILINIGMLICFTGIWFLTSEIIQNISRRERSIKSNVKKLKSMDEEKSKLTMRTTHELKGPFTAIKSYLFVLRDGIVGQLNPAILDVVHKMIQRTDVLTSSISNLILLNNLRTGNYLAEAMENITIETVIDKAIKKVQNESEKYNIKIITDYSSLHKIIPVFQKEIITMFRHILLNSIHFSPSSSSILVKTFLEKSQCVVEIQDSGIGIKPEAHEKVFDEYFRTNEGVQKYSHGTGLGLPIVKAIADLHAAALTIKSTPAEGTTITITFTIKE